MLEKNAGKLFYLRAGGQGVGHGIHHGDHGAVVGAIGLGVSRVGVDLLLGGGQIHGLGHSLVEQGLFCVGLNAVGHGGQHGIGAVIAQHGLDERVQIVAIVLGHLIIVVEALGHLVIGHGLGHLAERGVVHQVIHDGGVEVGGVELLLAERPQGLHTVQVIAGAVVLVHPGIGQLRQDLLLNGVQGDREDRLLAAEHQRVAVGIGGVAVAVRERDGHVKGLAGLVANDLVLKAVDERAAAQRQAVARVGAAGKGHAVHGAGVINVDGVAVGRGTVGHVLGGGVLAEQAVDLGLHVLAGGLYIGTLDRDGSVILRQGDIIQCPDALPVAVFIQTIAVSEVLVIVIRRGAQNTAGGLAGSGRRAVGLAAACRAQSQSSGADQTERLGDATFQKNTSCWNAGEPRRCANQTCSIIRGKNEKEKFFERYWC